MHRLVERQIKRVFGLNKVEFAQGLEELRLWSRGGEIPEKVRAILTRLGEFINRVGQSYEQNERDLDLRNRSLMLSSEELTRTNNRLRAESVRQATVIESLRATANRLLASSGNEELGRDDSSLEQLTVLMASLVDDYLRSQSHLNAANVQLERQKFALDQHAIVSITDTSGTIIYANDKFCRISGYSREELLGQNHRIVSSKRHERAFFRQMWQTIAAGEVWEGEVCNLAKGGGLYWVAATIVPWLDEKSRRPIQYIAIRTDISAQKLLEEQLRSSRKFLESLTESMGEGVYALDAEGRCTFLNREAEQLLGWSREELVQRNFHDSAHYQRVGGEPVAAEQCPILQKMREGGTFRSEDEILVHRSGRMFPTYIVSVPLKDEGRIVGSVAVFQDISERKAVEERLKSAMRSAEAASRAKSDFLANMSHEIRTPMNAIIGLSQLVLSTELSARQKDYVVKIHASSKTLLRILNDILDFSKIEAGRLELERVMFQMDEVLEAVITLVAPKAYEKKLELLCSQGPGVPARMRGDPLRLQQVLLNLLGNAIKFTTQGEVELRVEAAPCRGGEVELRFTVRDTGIGIKADQIESLFESFTQADTSTTRQYGGTGLGLAISRRLVELMGGTIAARSRPGVGSTFHFSVVMGVVPEDAVGPQPQLQLRGLWAGLVVDNVRSREILCEIMQSLTFRLCRQRQGHDDGLVPVWEEKPDIVVIDVPQRQRETVCNDLIRNLGSLTVPVVILCHQPEVVDIQEKYFGTNGIRVLVKPVTSSQLFDAVAELFGSEPVRMTCDIHENWAKSAGFRELAGKRVLLVEDNLVNQQVAVDLLELVGVVVDVAAHGADAMVMLRSHRYEAILMDVQMPVMDGYEAARRIRGELGLTIPIIAMTANAMVGDYEKSLLSGMNDHVAKPIDPQHLFDTLRRWIVPSLGVETPKEGSPLPELIAEAAVVAEQVGMDISLALRRCAGNVDLLERMMRNFVADQSEVLSNIGTALDAGDGERAIRLAHTLKGLAGSLGAEGLRTAAQRLERGLAEASGGVAELMEQVSRQLGPVQRAIAEWLSSRGADDPSRTGKLVVPAEELVALLQSMKHPLQLRQPKACQAIMARLEGAEWPVALRRPITELAGLVRKYRFRDAEHQLDELLQACSPVPSAR
ncbi:MAG: PAS domain S-box protein [Magnetococcales bacterium]|nr:PAS domain S-box protein [Magnetococcales bacterium]